jgi:hypothetical protein
MLKQIKKTDESILTRKWTARARQYWGLALGIGIYLSFVLIAFVVHSQPWNLEEDGVNFLIGAQTILTDHYWSTWSPGWAFLVWLISRTGIPMFESGKIIVGFSGLVFIISGFFIGSVLLDMRRANWVALLTATSYAVLAGGVLLGSHMTAAAIGLAGLFFFFARKSDLRLALSGLLIGIAIALRINYIALLGLGVLLVLDSKPWALRARSLAIWAAAVVIFASPILFLNRLERGSFLDTGQWRLAIMVFDPNADASSYTSLLQWILSAPLQILPRVFFRYVYDLPGYISQSLSWVGILGMAGVALVLVTRVKPMSSNERSLIGAVTAIALFCLPLALAPLDVMYLIFLLPLLAILSVVMLSRVNRNWFVAAMLVLVLLQGSEAIRLIRFRYLQTQETPDYASVGAFVQTNVPREAKIILVGQSHFSYYAGRTVNLDCRSLDIRAKALEYDYVVIDSRFSELGQSCLANLGIGFSELQELFTTATRPTITLYRIQK